MSFSSSSLPFWFLSFVACLCILCFFFPFTSSPFFPDGRRVSRLSSGAHVTAAVLNGSTIYLNLDMTNQQISIFLEAQVANAFSVKARHSPRLTLSRFFPRLFSFLFNFSLYSIRFKDPVWVLMCTQLRFHIFRLTLRLRGWISASCPN